MAGFTNTKAIIGFSLIPNFVIIDQLSKWLILDYILRPELGMPSLGLFEWFKNSDRLPFVSVELLPFFNLSMVWNQGVSFGLFQNDNPWPLTILAGLIALGFSFWLARSKNWIEICALSMVIGGAIGNIIDRMHFGAVADFFDFYIGNSHYPAFNIADSLISVGIVMLLIYSLFFAKNEKTESQKEAS